MKRTYIKDLENQTGKEVEVFGWVNSRRDHGKILFFDLRVPGFGDRKPAFEATANQGG